MPYSIRNDILGTVIVVDTLPDGVTVGVRDIGPSWNNHLPPRLRVNEITAERARVLRGRYTAEGYPIRESDAE